MEYSDLLYNLSLMVLILVVGVALFMMVFVSDTKSKSRAFVTILALVMIIASAYAFIQVYQVQQGIDPLKELIKSIKEFRTDIGGDTQMDESFYQQQLQQIKEQKRAREQQPQGETAPAPEGGQGQPPQGPEVVQPPPGGGQGQPPQGGGQTPPTG